VVSDWGQRLDVKMKLTVVFFALLGSVVRSKIVRDSGFDCRSQVLGRVRGASIMLVCGGRRCLRCRGSHVEIKG